MQQNKRLITISMLSAIAFILTFLKFPLPFLPPYLTLDFSDVPTLLATFIFGPLSGLLVALIKNILNFLFNIGDPVGPVANFLAGASFLLTAYFVSHRKQYSSRRSLIIGLVAGTIAMSIVLLPLYGMIFNLGDVFTNLKVIILSGIIPFNIIKGCVISIIFILLYRRLKKVLK